jgi:hypothetical protein
MNNRQQFTINFFMAKEKKRIFGRSHTKGNIYPVVKIISTQKSECFYSSTNLRDGNNTVIILW